MAPLLLLTLGAADLPTANATLDVSVSGLRSDKGVVLICLTGDAAHFPDCSKDKAARNLRVTAAKSGNLVFSDLRPGAYALSMIHDENDNGKMDVALFVPREGFGFSRNPVILTGPPKFRSAQFTVAEGSETRQSVRMKYMF
ncbi:MAG: DUF2141 domain-containing protein [Parasphingorhabdus sp.]|nr:DUF2141 domain-containing protein [Parasphingorhabdus sp.]